MQADCLPKSLEDCRVSDVIAAGRQVTPALFETRGQIAPVGLNSVKAKPVTAETFITQVKPGQNRVPVPPAMMIACSMILSAVTASTAWPLQRPRNHPPPKYSLSPAPRTPGLRRR